MTESEKEIEKALKLCRGHYQRSIVLGHARLSGSDLTGKAKKYGARYKESRDNILKRMQENKIQFVVAYEEPRNKQVLVFGERRIFLAKHGKQLRESTPNLFAELVKATETGKHYRRARALAELALDKPQ